MNIQEIHFLVLTRLRKNLSDVRTEDRRRDTSQWILSRFPDSGDSRNMQEFSEKHGYPLLIVKTPQISSASSTMQSDLFTYNIELFVVHSGSLALNDSLVKSVFDEIKEMRATNFWLEQGLQFVNASYEPSEDDSYTTQKKTFSSRIIISVQEDE